MAKDPNAAEKKVSEKKEPADHPIVQFYAEEVSREMTMCDCDDCDPCDYEAN